jgi:hypothetical protein
MSVLVGFPLSAQVEASSASWASWAREVASATDLLAHTYQSMCPAGLSPLPRKSGPAEPAGARGASSASKASASSATQAPTFCGEGGWGGGD